MEKQTNIHDKFFKSTFSHVEVAKGFIYEFVNKEISSLIIPSSFQLQSSSYVNKKLKETFSDIVYQVKTKNETPLLISFLFEHKSYPDNHLVLQLLQYMINAWEQMYRNKQELHLIIPVVIYHGEEKWEYKKLDDTVKIPNPKLAKYLAKFEYHFSNVNNFSEERLLGIAKFMKLRNTLLTLKNGRNETYVTQNMRKLFINAEKFVGDTRGTNFLETIFVYLLNVHQFDDDTLDQLIEVFENPVKKVMLSTYDRIVNKGIEQGTFNAKKNAIINMLQKDFDINTISEILEVDIDVIISIQKEMLS